MSKRTIVIVAEKPQAAERIARALSKNRAVPIKSKPIKVWEFRQDNSLIRVTSTRGHIYTTEFAREIHKKPWHKVNPKYLLTKAPLTKIVREENKRVVKALKSEIQRADEVIIATDYDREGENIGMQVATFIAKKVPRRITVRRAVFSSLTPREIMNAFKVENLTDLDKNKIDASEVRQELDLRYGVAFTRLATMHLHRRFLHYDLPLLSIGPCQTPTLGLIVDKYRKHLESVKKASEDIRYRVKLLVNLDGFKIEFKSKNVFSSAEAAKKFVEKIRENKAQIEVLEVKEKTRIKKKPLPLNTTRLASLAARHLNFSPHQTLNIAESLYLKGLISYPRTETDIYTKEILNKVFTIARKLVEVNKFDIELKGPRQGRSTDNAHPPIHPTGIIKFSQLIKKLKKREALLYELICRHFIANLSDDAQLEKLKITATLNGELFEAEIQRIIQPGFLKVYPYQSDSVETNLKQVPRLSKGAKFQVTKFLIEEVKPRITQPISYSELVDKMAKLGIGTDATFAEHIKKNIERGYVVEKKGRLIPTPYGLALAEALEKYAPEVIDPNIRASVEELFTKVERGELKRKEAIKIGIERFIRLYNQFSSNIERIIDIVERGLRKTDIRRLKRRR